MAKFWIDNVIDNYMRPCFRWSVLLLGPLLCFCLYALLALHVYAYFGWIVQLQQKRLGTCFALVWQSIGLILVYNIVYNHFLAMIIKPGSLKDLRQTEKLRQQYKNRSNRKSVANELDNDKNDRFEGVSKDVKQLLRYR